MRYYTLEVAGTQAPVLVEHPTESVREQFADERLKELRQQWDVVTVVKLDLSHDYPAMPNIHVSGHVEEYAA